MPHTSHIRAQSTLTVTYRDGVSDFQDRRIRPRANRAALSSVIAAVLSVIPAVLVDWRGCHSVAIRIRICRSEPGALNIGGHRGSSQKAYRLAPHGI